MAKVKDILQSALEAFGPGGENWAQGKKAYSRPKCCVTLSFTADHSSALEDFEIDEGCVALAKVLGISPDDLEPWNDDPLRKWPGGLVVQGGRVIEAAPIMRWAVNRTLVSIRGWVQSKNGSMAEVKRMES